MSHGQLPYGDIFSAATPALDRLSQQLYEEHKQRELERQQQIAAMDNEFSKNVTLARDADIDNFKKSYGDWRMATQELMKKKHATTEDQLKVLTKKADMYKVLNESKAEKEREEQIAKRYVVKPDDFNDNAGELIIKGRQLPLSQKRSYTVKDATGKENSVDLTNPENLLYQDKTDWQKILGKAEGTLSQRGVPVEESLPGGLETKVTTYKAKNSPLDFYNSIVGSMTTARASESLANRFKFSPEEAQVITDEFNAVKDTPSFKATYGKVDFPESSNLTEGLRTAKLLAMQHAIHNQPTSSFVNKPNKEAIMNKQQANKKEIQSIGNANSINRLYIYAGLQANKPLGPEDISRGADNLIVTHIKSASENGGELLVDADTFEALTGKKKSINSYLTVGQNGVYQYGVKDDNGKIEGTLTPVPYELAKTKIIKEYPKISAVNSGGQTKPNTQKPTGKQTYKVGNTTLTEDQLIKGAKKYNMTLEQYKKSIGL